MNSQGREAAQRLLAIIVIVAMLGVMGIPFSVIIFFATVTYFIWRAIQQSERQDTGRIFEFYIRANDILRDEERHWYGFEIAEVIERGERVLHSMTDPPPLIYYALGALYQQAGDHEAAIEHLSFVVDNEQADERHRFVPSPELRRYVHILRKLEREPTEAPQTMAAIRSLDRARRHRAAELLAQSREHLNGVQQIPQPAPAPKPTLKESAPGGATSPHAAAAPKRPATLVQPPPISDVLRDVYEEEKKTA
jgi:tetratricopeptide (TPR) repeat protein